MFVILINAYFFFSLAAICFKIICTKAFEGWKYKRSLSCYAQIYIIAYSLGRPLIIFHCSCEIMLSTKTLHHYITFLTAWQKGYFVKTSLTFNLFTRLFVLVRHEIIRTFCWNLHNKMDTFHYIFTEDLSFSLII